MLPFPKADVNRKKAFFCLGLGDALFLANDCFRKHDTSCVVEVSSHHLSALFVNESTALNMFSCLLQCTSSNITSLIVKKCAEQHLTTMHIGTFDDANQITRGRPKIEKVKRRIAGQGHLDDGVYFITHRTQCTEGINWSARIKHGDNFVRSLTELLMLHFFCPGKVLRRCAFKLCCGCCTLCDVRSCLSISVLDELPL